jgi:hypothetical protein
MVPFYSPMQGPSNKGSLAVTREPSYLLKQMMVILRSSVDAVAKGCWSCCRLYRSFTWEHFKAFVKTCSSTTMSLIWIIPAILIIIFVAQNISGNVVTIEPISVPKAFSENGYTPEVASHRLRDAINRFSKSAGSSIQNPNIALRGEVPDIIVPKIDLSLDTIISSVRRLLHYGHRRDISGEFTIRGKLAWLRLRVDGEEIYTSQSGFDPESPDELLAAAASAVVDNIQPYLIASALYASDKKTGL